MHVRYVLTALLLLLPSAYSLAQINVEYVINMGRQALGVDDNISAIHYFNQAIAARPNHSRAFYYRAYAKFVLEDYGGAERDCTEAITLNPYHVEVFQLRGLCRLQLKDFRGAVGDYTRALHEFPTDEAALFNRALCYLELHLPDSAEAGMDEFLRLKPNFYRAYMFKAQVELEERRDTVRALAWIDSVLVRHPEEPGAWQFKGQWAARQEAYAEADSFLTRAIEYQQPPRFENFLMRAQVRHAQNRFGAALEDYDRVIELIPRHFAAHYNRALLRALVGDDNRAIEDFSFILEIEPDNTLARYNRALLREQTGDIRGAIDDYTVLLRAYPDFLYGYHARAQLRRRLGDVRGALNDETVIARRNYDVAFAKPRRSFVRKVRQRSEHALEQYDQVISTEEETNDTIRVFGDAVFGKVQNTHTERELLPMFVLALHPSQARGYQSNAFLAEAEALSQRTAPLELAAERQASGHFLREPARRLVFTTERGKEEVSTLEEHIRRIEALQRHETILPREDYRLLLSALYSNIYRGEEARSLADSVVLAAPEALLPRLHRAAILALALQVDLSEKSDTQPLLTLAMADLEKAAALAPDCALIFYNRAWLEAKQGNHKAALADLDHAIELDPRLPEAYYNRALVRILSEGDAQQAAADLSRAGELGLYRAYSILKQISAERK